MTKSMAGFFASSLFIFSTALAGPSSEKLKYDLLSTLLKNSQLSIAGRKGCEPFVQNGQKTLSAFVAKNLSYFEENKMNSISASCETHQKKIQCVIQFQADSKSEAPWACGVRFEYREKQNSLIDKTIECIGSC